MSDFTYPEVGATRGPLPRGCHHVHASRLLGVGDEVFERAVGRLMSWEMHRAAGLEVRPSAVRVEDGADVEMRWLGQRIPCRVVYVLDEDDRRGFAYGTLTGHPECGEESFIIERDPHTREVRALVTAFSKPATVLTKLIGPVGRLLQTRMTNRYLKAL